MYPDVEIQDIKVRSFLTLLCPMTQIYYVLNPKSEYFDPYDNFSESSVKRTVDKKFCLETLNVVENSVNDYDWDKIDSFRNSISYRDKCSYLNMP